MYYNYKIESMKKVNLFKLNYYFSVMKYYKYKKNNININLDYKV